MVDKQLTPFGVWLKQQAAARQMSMAEIARRAGLNKSTLTLTIYGKPPRIQSCGMLADALGLPVEQVLRAAGHLRESNGGTELPGELWDLLRDLQTVSPEVRQTVIETWRAALQIARARS